MEKGKGTWMLSTPRCFDGLPHNMYEAASTDPKKTFPFTERRSRRTSLGSMRPRVTWEPTYGILIRKKGDMGKRGREEFRKC